MASVSESCSLVPRRERLTVANALRRLAPGWLRVGGILLKNNRRNSREEAIVRPQFDSDFYLKTYPDVKKAGIDPVRHYLYYGWLEGRNPTPTFNTIMYLALNDDVRASKMNPFCHYILYGRDEHRLGSEIANLRNDLIWSRAPHRMQDITFPRHVENAESLFVVIVPEHNTMSGGIYSFFSIAKAAYNLRHKHNYAIVLMTRPNTYDLTYLRQGNFRNSEDVFRFSQVTRCKNVKELYLQIPEYAAPGFVAGLTSEQREYLLSRDRLYINILNQKIELMPEVRFFFGEIGSVFAIAVRNIRNFEVEDTVAITFTFPNGALGTFLLSDTAASSKSWEMTAGENPAYPHFPAENCYHFAGTNGSLDFPSMEARYYSQGSEPSWWRPFERTQIGVTRCNPLERQLDHLVDVARGRAAPRVSARDGYLNMLVVQAIGRSIATERAVNVETALG